MALLKQTPLIRTREKEVIVTKPAWPSRFQTFKSRQRQRLLSTTLRTYPTAGGAVGV